MFRDDSHKKQWEELYSTCSNRRGRCLSLEGRANELEGLAADDPSLTYGEIEFDSFSKILAKCQPQQHESFYDLGHGTGKAIFATALLNQVSSCHGIELLCSLYKESKRIYQHYYAAPCKVELRKGDFTNDLSWLKGDIVFTNSTCFTLELQHKLQKLAPALKSGARFVTLNFSLNLPQYFQLVHDKEYEMSWGFSRARIYIRNYY